jgi:hypothetical protein
MEVTDRPRIAIIPLLAAVAAIVVVALRQGGDALALAFPSFITILPLLGAGRTACWLAGGLLAAVGIALYSFGGLFLLPAAALLAAVGGRC